MDLHSSIMNFVLFSILFLIFSNIWIFFLLLSAEADLLMQTALSFYYAENSTILFVMLGYIFHVC